MKKKIGVIFLMTFSLLLLTSCGNKSYYPTKKAVYSYLNEHYPNGKFEILSVETREIDGGITCPKKLYSYSIKSLDNNVIFTLKDDTYSIEWCVHTSVDDFLFLTLKKYLNDSRIEIYQNRGEKVGLVVELENFDSVEEMANILYYNVEELKNVFPFNSKEIDYLIRVYKPNDYTSVKIYSSEIDSWQHIVDIINNS